MDTLETIDRAVLNLDKRKPTVTYWSNGKEETYRLRKDGTPGKLLGSSSHTIRSKKRGAKANKSRRKDEAKGKA